MLVPHCICSLVSGFYFFVDIFRFMQNLFILFANFYKNALCCSHVRVHMIKHVFSTLHL